MQQLTQPLATIIGALIAAFLGSWVGAYLALSRFKKERAFDRQLDWYERMTRSLYDMAQKIEIAKTHQDENRQPEHLIKCWRDVQRCQLVLQAVAFEADLYGSIEAANIAADIASNVQTVADATEAFDPGSWEEDEAEELLNMIVELPDKLTGAAKPLAAEARRHLGLSGNRLRLTSRSS